MKRILTHAFALLVGVALAAALPRLIHPQARAGSTDLTDESGAMDSAKSADRAAISAGRGDGKPAAFRQAWGLLMQEAQAPEERMRAQGNLLREWAKVDLEGAIQAYLGEAWDTRYPGTLAYTSEPLRNALVSEFYEQPQQAWKLLSRDKVAMQLLGPYWCTAMAAKDPALLIATIRGLPPNLQKDAASALMQHKQKRQLLIQLARTGTPEQAERWLADAYTRASADGSTEELLARWHDAAPGIERTHDMMAWASRFRHTDPAELAAEWEKIPEADRAQAARLLLAPLNEGSPGLLDAIDRAVETDQWQAFTPDLLGTLRHWEAGDANALASWAKDLPAKPELASVYQTALLKKFADPAQGREWIEQLPEGSWHRDQALAALARSEIEKNRDLSAANRTVETISDPDIRRAAEEALYDHALKQGIQNLR